MPVIILSGSDYEMGYQYGQQVGQYIEIRKDARWASSLRKLGNRKKVIYDLKGFQYYIKKYVPEEIEMMKGIADGATNAGYKLSYMDILLLNAGIRRTSGYTYPSGAEAETLPPEECSHWSAWGSTTTDGSLICADSADQPFDYHATIVAFPDGGNNFITTVLAGGLARHPAMNNKGVFLGSSGGPQILDGVCNYGITRPCAIQHLIRFANTAAEAVDMLSSWDYARSNNFHFSDVGGSGFVVETTAAVKSVRKSGDYGETDFIYATNNFFNKDMQEANKGEEFIKHVGWTGKNTSISSIPRNKELWNMFHNYHGKVDLDFAKMMWRYPGSPPPYPIDKKAYYTTQGKGWDQKICNQFNAQVVIALPNNGDKGVMYICTGPAAQVAHPLRPSGYSYQIAGTHTFYKLTLGSNPEAVVEDAKKTAQTYITEAHRKFVMLNYTDTGYAILNELYSQANSEYYRGINFYNKGLLANGNEALFYLSQATTSFSKSQCRAQQVYNALVPPASSPKDLGFKPY